MFNAKKVRRFLLPLILMIFQINIFAQETSTISPQGQEELQAQIKNEVVQNGVFPYEKFKHAMSGKQLREVDAFADELLNSYINERLLEGLKPSAEFHNFLFEFYPDLKKTTILENLIRFRVFTPFTEDLVSHLEEIISDGKSESTAAEGNKEIAFVVEHYRGIRLYEQNSPETEDEWTSVFDYLYRAYRIRPLRTDTGILRESAKKTGNKRVMFEITAYDYYNREDENFFRRAALFLRYIITPGKTGGFRSELEAVRNKLRSDLRAEIERSTPENLPDFEPVQLYSFEDGTEININPSDSEPPIGNIPFILSFFSTNCGYCIEELLVLQDLLHEAEETGTEKSFAVLPVSADRLNLEEFTVSILDFSDRYGFTINFFQGPAPEGSLTERYGIRNVPVMLLFDESGKLLARVQYHHLGHLDLKIRWLLEDFFNITL